MNPSARGKLLSGLLLLMMAGCGPRRLAAGVAVFNVRDYGATGAMADDARPAIQKAIDACAAAGGGEVYLPAGEYTSGTLKLRSHVRFYIEAGATLYGSQDPRDFAGAPIVSQAALFFGEGVEEITIEGRGTVNGQGEYEMLTDDNTSSPNYTIRMGRSILESMGKPPVRFFPKGYPHRTVYPHLVYLGHCKDVHITGLSFLRSASWTMALYACERVVVDGVYIYTDPHQAVWADGIDLDGCRDVRISNSSIETGDDCIIFISTANWGPALPCENITVSNCRLHSASAGIKFSEGNSNVIRHITVDNCVITQTNRGIVFAIITGGLISDVIISNIVMDLNRYELRFWAGGAQPFFFRIARQSEWDQEPRKPGEPAPGAIRNIVLRDMIIHAQGASPIDGHPESWIDGLSIENIKLFLTTDPAAPYDLTTFAMRCRWVKNLKLQGIEVHWDTPALNNWQTALELENVQGVDLDDFTGRQAWPDQDFPAVAFENVADATIRNSRAPEGTGIFLKVGGNESGDIRLFGNDLRKAKAPYLVAPEATAARVTAEQNLIPAP